jgi:glycosyltransferase involved in cell wall biosynthesis
MSKAKLAIIMPAYNEAGNITRAVRDAVAAVPGADVIVINDGSTDATSPLACEAGAFVIDLPYNLGIGGAVQTGYRFVAMHGYHLVARLDGDGQHDPAQLASLIEPVMTGHVDIAIGSRFVVNDVAAGKEGYRASPFRAIGIWVFARLVSLIIGQRVTDTTSGFQVCNADAAAFFARDFPSDYPEVEMIAASCRAGYRICEVPVTMRKRAAGRSSITSVRSVYYVLKVLLALVVGLLRPPAKRVEAAQEAYGVPVPRAQVDYGVA